MLKRSCEPLIRVRLGIHAKPRETLLFRGINLALVWSVRRKSSFLRQDIFDENHTRIGRFLHVRFLHVRFLHVQLGESRTTGERRTWKTCSILLKQIEGVKITVLDDTGGLFFSPDVWDQSPIASRGGERYVVAQVRRHRFVADHV